MVKLVKINEENVWSIVNLEVYSNQKDYVASNSESLIEAYLYLANNRIVMPFGIYDDEKPIGFLMIGFDDTSSNVKIAKNNYCLWRLMIDKKYQRKGYGRKAIQLALDYIKEFPFGKAEYCYVSYDSKNQIGKDLYKSFGFVENGEMDDNEKVAILKL